MNTIILMSLVFVASFAWGFCSGVIFEKCRKLEKVLKK